MYQNIARLGSVDVGITSSFPSDGRRRLVLTFVHLGANLSQRKGALKTHHDSTKNVHVLLAISELEYSRLEPIDNAFTVESHTL